LLLAADQADQQVERTPEVTHLNHIQIHEGIILFIGAAILILKIYLRDKQKKFMVVSRPRYMLRDKEKNTLIVVTR
jgi:hypothetical protein